MVRDRGRGEGWKEGEERMLRRGKEGGVEGKLGGRMWGRRGEAVVRRGEGEGGGMERSL